MTFRCLIITLGLLSHSFIFAQQKNKTFIAIEAGILNSIGPISYATKYSNTNPVSVYYMPYKRYRHTSLKLRVYIFKNINPQLNMGIKTGANFRNFEENFDTYQKTNFSIPVMFFNELKLFDFNIKNHFSVGTGLGYNFMHIVYPYVSVTENGGLTYTAEFIYLKSTEVNDNNISIRIGYEFQQDNNYYVYIPPVNSNLKKEKISFIQRNRQVSITLGYTF